MPSRNFLSVFQDAEVRGRIFLVLAVLGILIVAILLSGPKPVEYTADGAEVVASGETVITQAAAKVEEYDTTVTTGVLVGAVAIIVIIEAGTLIELKRNSD